jgi:hypothetical protein
MHDPPAVPAKRRGAADRRVVRRLRRVTGAVAPVTRSATAHERRDSGTIRW